MIPTQSSQWTQDQISLNNLLGYDDVFIKFEGFSDGGNNFLVDNLMLNLTTGFEKLNNDLSIEVYPNPITDRLEVHMGTQSLNQKISCRLPFSI